MAKFCDLHTHSTYSDGTVTPTELIRLAKEAGLSAVALCDHNTVAGLPEFRKAGAESGITAVEGVEFSTDYRETELHILGLFIPAEHHAAVTGKLAQMLVRKEQSNRDLVTALNGAGLELNYDAIKAGTPDGQVNRAVIAAEMVKKGYCESVKAAFSQWLSPRRGYYQPPKRLDVFETIRFIKSIGAVAVLAHPFLNLNETELCMFLREAVPAGLDGMEVFYSTFSPEETALAREIAARFGLLPSGGSDFHGRNKPDISLGSGKNNLCVPLSILEDLAAKQASM